MNRIYKVIWSKVKHQYVVVSELAHRDGKQSKSERTATICGSLRAIAAALMVSGAVLAMPYTALAAENATNDNTNEIILEENNEENIVDTKEKVDNTNENLGISPMSVPVDDGSISITYEDSKLYSSLINIGNSSMGSGSASYPEYGDGSIVIGLDDSFENVVNIITIGNNTKIDASSDSVIIGNGNEIHGVSLNTTTSPQISANVAIGSKIIMGGDSNTTTQTIQQSTAVGSSIYMESGDNNTAVGYNSKIYDGNNNIAIGTDVIIGADDTYDVNGNIAIGDGARITIGGRGSGNNVMALGRESVITGSAMNTIESMAIGHGSEINSAAYSIALGANTKVENVTNSVALGYGSRVTEKDILKDYKSKIDAEWNATDDNKGVISVGYDYTNNGFRFNADRRIIHVAKGRIEADSTDAVNGSQLRNYWIADDSDMSLSDGGKLTLTFKDAYGIDTEEYKRKIDLSSLKDSWNIAAEGQGATKGTLSSIVDKTNNTVNFVGKENNNHKNIEVSMKPNEAKDGYDVEYDIADRLELGNTETGDQIVIDATEGNGYIQVGNDDTGVKISSNGNATFGEVNITNTNDSATIDGLTNTKWEPSKYNVSVENGGYDGSTKAATESQLQGAVGYAIDKAETKWNLTTNSNPDGQQKTTIGKNNTVDFSPNSPNVEVTQEQIKDGKGNIIGTSVKFDLADDITVNSVTAGNTFIDSKGFAIKNGNEYDYYITNEGLNANGHKITNVEAGKDGTDAVNVDQLNEAIGGTYQNWTVSTDNGTKKTDIKNGNVVEFSGKDNNINVSQEQTDNGTNITFDLADDITVNSVTAGNTFIDSKGFAIKNGNEYDYYITNEGLNANGHKITNVEAGKDGTDAVNVDQLNEAIGGTYKGWNVTTNGDTAESKPINSGNTVDFAGKNENGHSNIVVTKEDTKDGTSVKFDLDDDLKLGHSEDGAYVDIFGSEGKIYVGNGKYNITIDGTTGTIGGLSNTTWDYNNQEQYRGSSQAATEGQLHDAIGNVKQEVIANDQHLVANPDAENGHYSVTDNQVGLKVQTGVDEEGKPKYNTVTIDNVAAASDVGDVNDFNEDLMNKDEDGNVTHTTVVDAVNNLDGRVDNLEENITEIGQTAGQHSSVSNADKNITVDTGKNEAGGIDYKVGLNNEKITVGNDNNNVTIEGTKGNITVTGSVTAGQTVINNEGVSVGGNTYITNEGINSNGHKITNVAAGEADTDAVNVGQLNEVRQRVDMNSGAINNMGNQINRLGDRIDKVGAGAAALAALHPLDFDPDDKLSFAAGYGNYAGENAVAIGAFYQPNEDTLFSVGGTVGNDENMVNVGVSFKLGQKNHVSNNRVAMAKEIISLRDKMAQLEALLAHQGVLPQGQIDTSRLFPDVPENHWAYEYVKELAKIGVIEGYPDGNYDGDRMMTRYEMAAIIYRAMQKGVNVDRRMLSEFEPELKLIRVDVIAKDRDGNPTIERVRVNEPEDQQAVQNA